MYAAADDPVAETSSLAGILAAEQGVAVPAQTPILPAGGTPDDPGNGSGNGNGNGRGRGPGTQVKQPSAPDPDALRPIVKQEHEKIGRNEPCWCGSGKKYKLCHGAA